METLTVRYENYDGTVLFEKVINVGDSLPEYSGSTPVREPDIDFYYVFTGFEVTYEDENTLVYTATYSAKDYKNTDNWYWYTLEEGGTDVYLGGFFDAEETIEDLYIPESFYSNGIKMTVVGIGFAAIQTHGVKRIHIPKTVSDIDPNFIMDYYSSQVQEIIVDPENSTFASKDGVLYTKDMTKLVKMPFQAQFANFVLPDTVKEIGESAMCLTEGIRHFTVTENSQLEVIGYQAFSESSILIVDLPEGLKTIGDRAFWLCDRIQSLNIPGTVDFNDDHFLQFASMDSLTQVVLNEGITYVSDSAFQGCPSLSSVTLPSTLEVIDTSAFSSCERLTSIVVPDNLKEIGMMAFMNSGLSSIKAASSTSSTSSFILPDSVTTIGSSAFSGSNLYGSVTIGKNLSNISYDMFSGTTISAFDVDPENASYKSENGLVYSKDGKTLCLVPPKASGSFVLSDEVETIGSNAFNGNTGIVSFTAGSGLKEIQSNAFSGATGIQEIHLDDALTTIGSSAFNGMTALREITIPGLVKELPDSALSNCVNLERVDLGKVETIGMMAFSGCTNLQSIDLKNTKTLDMMAFYNCSNLESVDLGSVTKIGGSAFSYCSKLADINLEDSVVESIDSYAFSGLPLTDVVLPATLKDTTLNGTLGGLSELVTADFSKTKAETLSYGFAGSSQKLEQVILPATIKTIGSGAFSYSPVLTNIDFCGTEEQWNAIELQNNWWGYDARTKDVLKTVTVNYGTAEEKVIDIVYPEQA